MRNNVIELLAQKARQRDQRSISVRAAAIEMNISYYTLTAIVNNSIREYPVDVLTKLCDYFDCNVGDILS